MKVLVVEEHDLIAEIIQKSLELDGYAVTLCGSIVDGARHAATLDYDLAVFDPQDADLTGSRLYLDFARVTSGMRMLPLRGYGPDGASAKDDSRSHLPKPFSPTEFRERVRSLLSARRPKTEFAYADASLNPVTRKATRAGRHLDLSSGEFSILEHFIRFKGSTLVRTRCRSRSLRFVS